MNHITGARRLRGGGEIAAIAFLFIAAQARAMSPGWLDLPNTKLRSVCPPNGFEPEVSDGRPYPFTSRCQMVIGAWSTGIADTTQDKLFIWGGGHVDYGGNELYALDINAKTLSRLTDPSGPAVYDNNAACGAITSNTFPYTTSTAHTNFAMPDGKPNIRHTQGTLVFIPTLDKMLSVDGGTACGDGPHYADTWMLDLQHISNAGAGGWQQMDPVNGTNNFYNPTGQFGNWWAVMAYDPNADKVLVNLNNQLFAYDYRANTYKTLNNNVHFPVAANAALDPTRKLLIEFGMEWPFGGASANYNYFIKKVDVSGAPYTTTDITSQVVGCMPPPVQSDSTSWSPWFLPGMAYDPVIDRIVIWPNSGNKVYLFNPDTNSCTTQTLPGMPPTIYNVGAGNGSIGRFAYFPDQDVFALVADVDQDAYLLKLDNSSAGVAPDPIAPSAPTTLLATAASSTQINLSWSAATDNVGVQGYAILRGGNQVGTTGLTSYTDSGLTPGTAYTYTVVAFDAAGNRSVASVQATATTATSGAPAQPAAPINGLGHSTLTCIDKDGDGYGVGPGCRGPDADDNDGTVHRGDEVITKYGGLSAFLTHRGYAPANIWYLAPNGIDASTSGVPNCKNNINAPCLTFPYLNAKLQPGDMLMLRDQWSGYLNLPSGTAGHPIYVMSYPGEQANFVGNANRLDIPDRSYLVIDGLKFSSGAYISGGTTAGFPDPPVNTFHDNIFRNIDAVGPFAGLAGINGFGMANVTVEDSAFHDNDAVGSQHGIYMGSRHQQSTNVVFQRLLLYHNNWNGIHWNGQCSSCAVRNVIAYSNGISGLDFEMGWNHSFIQNNLSFNNAKALTFYDYPGQCPSQNNYSPNTVYICPYDENYNIIENNTLYNTGNDGGFNTLSAGCPPGVDDCEQAAISVRNVTNPLTGNFDHNIFRNNIVVNYGFNNHNPPVAYSMNNGAGEICDATCQNWMSTSIWDHNLFFQADGHNGVNVISAVAHAYSCATAGTVTAMTACMNTDPKFTAASIAYWNSIGSFNFSLQSNSPPVAAGTATGAPIYDIVGNAFGNPPSLGAYEFGSHTPTLPVNPPTNPPPPDPSVPTLQVSFGSLPIDATLRVDNASAFPGDIFNWTFTPNPSSPDTHVEAASSVTALTAGSIAARGSAVQPLSVGLSLGAYQVSVVVMNGNTVVASAAGQITFVSGNLSGVRVYPNPWRSDKHAGHPTITFAGLTVGTTIKIFTVSGHEAKELHTDGPSIPWDLTNNSDDKVASGIYLYVITDAAGDKAKGKVAIIK